MPQKSLKKRPQITHFPISMAQLATLGPVQIPGCNFQIDDHDADHVDEPRGAWSCRVWLGTSYFLSFDMLSQLL